MTFDEILDALGGCGLYQVGYFMTIVTGMAAGVWILYSMYYFELEPTYNFRFNDGPWMIGKKVNICERADK